MKSPREAGFTLIELILALAITGVVLLTIVFLSTNAMRYQTDAVFRNRASSSALYSLARMRRELEDATYLPDQVCGSGTLSTTGCNFVVACTNWSALANAAYVPAAPVTTVYYTVDDSLHQMYRYVSSGACNPGYTPSGSPEIVVPNPPGMYHDDYPGSAVPVFQRSGDSGLNIRYAVGYPGMKPNLPVPVNYRFDVHINTNKSYTNTGD